MKQQSPTYTPLPMLLFSLKRIRKIEPRLFICCCTTSSMHSLSVRARYQGHVAVHPPTCWTNTYA